jgi:hypothetical protein
MSVSLQSVHANRDYFAHKLHAEKQRNDVLKAVEGRKFDFVLLDTRGREPFADGHIPGRGARLQKRSTRGSVAAGGQGAGHLLLEP